MKVNQKTLEPLRVQPAVGMGATLCYPQDKYPLLITKVTAKTICVRMVHTSGDTAPDIKPADRCNGFPVFDYQYSAEELQKAAYGEEIRCYKRQNNRYYTKGGSPIALGFARYYRNYAD